MAEIKGFHKAHCDLCNHETWHYKEAGNIPAHCTEHSNWNPTRKHAVVGTVMQAQLSPVHQAPSERELRIANRLDRSLWKHAEEYASRVTDVTGENWTRGLFTAAAPAVKDPDKQYCTFCGNAVDKINTLSEKKPVVRKVVDTYRDVDGKVVITEKVVTRAETVHACPNCCLQIRKPVIVRTV